MILGEKIKLLRQQAGLSQSQLAQALNVSRAAIAKWENNNGTPDVGNLKALASYFRCDLDSLLDDSSDFVPTSHSNDQSYENVSATCEQEEQRQQKITTLSQLRSLKDYLWVLLALSVIVICKPILFGQWLLGSIPAFGTMGEYWKY